MRVLDRRVVLSAAAVLVLVAPLAVESRYGLGMLVFVALNGLPAVGLSLVMGFAGQVSLGQAAFFAVGAYVSGVLTATHGWNGWVALLCAVAAAAALAFVVGLPIFRLSGLLLAMATLAFGIIIYYVLVNWSAVTGGPSGLAGIPPLKLGGFRFDTDARMFWLTWGSLLGVLALAGNLV
ncbi:MAG TPA: branched-chain amino acid ABC transporter permease, partial [Methylomirabilota bacterium]|nr:branched-chain amino acid ABC transporter permease [Methylomirabilota bacterium]